MYKEMSTDKKIEWFGSTSENEMEKKVVGKAISTGFHFLNDTACLVIMEGKNYSATYIVDDEARQDETAGIRIRISYEDNEFSFADGSASMVTYTYLVEGISDKNLLLETPRSLNRKNIILLMNREAVKE